MTRIGGSIRRTLLGVAIVALGACSAQLRDHGYVPSDEDLSAVLVGVDTRDTVADIVGPPTAGGVLSDSGFYYVASTFRHFGALAPREVDREVVAITFDGAGVVDDVARYGLQDGRVVQLSRRVTDDNIRDTTLLRQLFSAFGRFDAGTFLGSDS